LDHVCPLLDCPPNVRHAENCAASDTSRASSSLTSHVSPHPRFALFSLQESLQSGFLTPRQKLTDALRLNARFYIVAGSVGIILYILLLLSTHSISIFHLLLAAGNTYGLLLALLLLGYGLVDIPRSLFQRASPAIQVDCRYLLSSSLDSDLFESVWVLQDGKRVLAPQRSCCPTNMFGMGGLEEGRFVHT